MEDNIKTDVKEIRFEGMEWVQLTQDMIQWCVPVHNVIKFILHKRNEFIDTCNKNQSPQLQYDLCQNNHPNYQ
jgi:hypothetical protein